MKLILLVVLLAVIKDSTETKFCVQKINEFHCEKILYKVHCSDKFCANWTKEIKTRKSIKCFWYNVLRGKFECNPPICEQNCGLHSKCTAPNVCTCNEGYNRQLDSFMRQVKRNNPNCDGQMANCRKWITEMAPIGSKITCCEGYRNFRKKCIPQCDKVCENSKCTAPNVCTCNEGFKEFSPFRCIPACDNCNHGLCIGPNICECYGGYKKNSNGICDPFCKNKCLHGTCVEPDVCKCNDGYEFGSNDLNTCYPICKDQCVNGKCIAPNTCDCFPGYEMKLGSTNQCLPVCDFCESGNCTGPSKCTCWENYRETEVVQNNIKIKVCKPICHEKCVNGNCVEVNTCECNDGYRFANESTSVCEPACYPECVNADCVAPNKCSCHKGYSLQNEKCQPICDNPCHNGYCHKPNECRCHDLFEFNEITKKCEPICRPPCINGTCVNPNECECLPQFKKISENICEKICDPECIFGECHDGFCICQDGFKLSEGSTHECIPDCMNPCINGDCVAPNTCECFDRFTKVSESKCERICEPECIFGECNDGLCICQDGFKLSEGSTHECIPDCMDPCINGDCVAPNTCECFDRFTKVSDSKCERICEPECIFGQCNDGLCICQDSFKLSEGSTHECIPDCMDPCINGDCVAPNTCECFDRFTKVSDSKCERICEPECIFGECNDGLCICQDGFKLREGSTHECIPDCMDPCINGDCVAPNTCECFDRFTKVSESKCERICEPECIFGQCNDGLCICQDGFKLSQGSTHECIPDCMDPCINGDCVAPNTCECFDRFTKVSDSKCEKICEPECIFGECHDGVCICQDGYKLRNDSTFECDPFCQNPCINGICIEPNKCECFENYEQISQNACEKICEPSCIFGECINGTCVCDEGYYLLENSIHECQSSCEISCINGACINGTCIIIEPVCTPECENGTCIAENFCKCWEGYQLSHKNQCEPICGEDGKGCTNGVCVAPYVCECRKGFEPSLSTEYVCEIEMAAATMKIDLLYIFLTSFLIIAILILIITTRTRNRKINYRVKKAEQTWGVQYVSGKEKQEFI